MFAYISVSVLMLAISAQESSVAFFATGTEKQRQCMLYVRFFLVLKINTLHRISTYLLYILKKLLGYVISCTMQ